MRFIIGVLCFVLLIFGVGFKIGDTKDKIVPVQVKKQIKTEQKIEPKIEKKIEVSRGNSRHLQYDIPLSDDLKSFIYNECERYDISYELALAIIKTESKFNHKAVSITNDFGLFQLNKNTYPWIIRELDIKNKDIMNPKTNIMCGIYYLNYLKNHYVNLGYSDEDVFKFLIVSYNRGIGGAKGINPESNSYFKKVVKNKTEIEKGNSQ